MATGLQAGISDAGAGAGVGSLVGGPYGAAIGGALGFLGGSLFGGSSTPTAPLFSDINLAKDNPTLYAQLQSQQNVVNQLQQLYNQRSTGMTPNEQAELQQSQGQLAGSLASRGMAGTSAGQAAAYGNAIQNQNNVASRIQQQQQQLAQELSGAQSGLTSATQSGLNQTMEGMYAPYNQQLQQGSNQNQMYNGLFQGGLSLLGGALNRNNIQGMQGQSNGMLPQGYGMGPGGIQFQGGQSPYGGGYAMPGTSFGQMPMNIMPQQQNYGYSLNPATSG